VYFDSTGLLHVSGTHTYPLAGNYPVTVSVIESPPAGSLQPTILYTINSKAVVTGIANSPGGVTIHEAAKVPFTAIVGYFNVPPSPTASPVAPVIQALINWGDGTTSMGTIVRQTSSTTAANAYAYAVQGTHTYATAATFGIVVTVYEASPLPGPTPLQGGSTTDPLWVLLIAQINSTAIVLVSPVAIA
jgi:hypothetical protein